MSNKSNLEKVLENSEEAKLVIDDFSESAHRVRRNLLIFSVISLFYALSGGAQSGTVDIYGLKFSNPDPELIAWFLLIIVFYHLAHFFWISLEHFKLNKIRLGGSFNKIVKLDEYSVDMTTESNLFIYLKKRITDLDATIKSVQTEIDSIRLNPKLHSGVLKDDLNQFHAKMKPVMDSLDRYREGYNSYGAVQKWRWIVIEYCLPVILGLASVFFLLNDILFVDFFQKILRCMSHI